MAGADELLVTVEYTNFLFVSPSLAFSSNTLTLYGGVISLFVAYDVRVLLCGSILFPIISALSLDIEVPHGPFLISVKIADATTSDVALPVPFCSASTNVAFNFGFTDTSLNAFPVENSVVILAYASLASSSLTSIDRG